MQNLPNITLSTNDIIHSLPYLAAEWTIITGFLLVILCDLFLKKSENIIFTIAALALGLSAFFLINQLYAFTENQFLFNGMFNFTKAVIQFKLLVVFASFLSLIFFKQDLRLKKHPKGINDFLSIFLAAVLGMFLLISSANLLMFYLSIEMISLASYLMVSYNAYQNKQAEAGMKYVLFGVVASAIMLYGISLIYGFTGSIDLFSDAFVLGLNAIGTTGASLALILLMVGIGFKLSFVPFHFWTPDAYQEAPTSVTSFLASVPKISVFGLLYEVFSTFQLVGNGLFSQMILGAAIFSMIIGNVIAIFQDNPKRMMAYSSIGHTGFILMLFLLPQVAILKALLFYLLAYTLMNAGSFMSFTYLDNKFGVLTISNYKGLGKKEPFIGACMVIMMVSLTGLPPTAGFIAKFLVFSSLINLAAYSTSVAFLLVIAALTTIISLFYYLKIPLNFFLKSSEDEHFSKGNYPGLLVLIGIISVLIVVLGLFPSVFALS